MAGQIIIRKSGPQFYYSLYAGNSDFAGNSERILQSEMYDAKASAVGGAQSVRVNSGIDSQYEQLTAEDGKPYFVLRGVNHEVIGVSETYISLNAREQGMASCKLNGPSAQIIDQA